MADDRISLTINITHDAAGDAEAAESVPVECGRPGAVEIQVYGQRTGLFFCVEDAELRSDIEQVVVGPKDTLVLLTRTHLDQARLAEMAAQLPESARGRVIVADGALFDVRVVRGISLDEGTPAGSRS